MNEVMFLKKDHETCKLENEVLKKDNELMKKDNDEFKRRLKKLEENI
jgi:hypothetical protein